MTVTQAWTENGRNVVPDRLMLNVNYRFAPGKSLPDAIRELEIGVRACIEPGEVPEGVDFDASDASPAGAVCLDHPLVVTWREQFGLEVEAKQAWTDVAQLTAAGISALNFGPAETAQAHQANESVPIAMLAAGYPILRALFVEDP